jgi:hypothetical protein
MNNFIIRSLQHSEFTSLFEPGSSELEKSGAIKMTVNKNPGFPCRVSLQDAEIGEEVILLPYQHHKTNSPYQSSGPIFIRKNAVTANLEINEIPAMLVRRLLSIRAYDKYGMMLESFVVEGTELKSLLTKIFSNPEINYAHVHNAKAGCYNCKVERA